MKNTKYLSNYKKLTDKNVQEHLDSDKNIISSFEWFTQINEAKAEGADDIEFLNNCHNYLESKEKEFEKFQDDLNRQVFEFSEKHDISFWYGKTGETVNPREIIKLQPLYGIEEPIKESNLKSNTQGN